MEVTSSQAAVRELVAAHPLLRPVFDEHVEFEEHEFAHLIMADIARLVGKIVAEQGRDPSMRGQIESILRTLDRQLREGDYDVKNVIAVSFLEQLPSTGEPGAEIRDLLTPDLRTVFDEVNY